jgi:3-oxoacyl-[acyl-carrier-protein] synthase II
MEANCRCVISGIGLASPAGSEVEEFVATLAQGKPLFESLAPSLDCSQLAYVARVNDDQLKHELTSRQLRKLDRFTVLAIAATRSALIDAQYELTENTCRSLGLLIGNCTGGWNYVEPQMYDLYTVGIESISPYVATAWFPAAPQGEISILYGIQGYSKTLAADRISSGYALELALWLIGTGRLDAAIVGGSESPLSHLVLNAFRQGGYLSEQATYQPFGADSDGCLLGEGAGMLLVEGLDKAVAAQRPIYAEVLAVAKAMELEQAMRRCLEIANVQAKQIDYLILDAAGTRAEDEAEYKAIAEVFSTNEQLRMSAPKSMYGNTLGANMALDLIIASLSLKRQMVLPTVKNTSTLPPPVGTHVVGHPEYCPLHYILINGRDSDGQSLVILLQRFESARF